MLDANMRRYIELMYPEGLSEEEKLLLEDIEARINMGGGSMASRQILATVIELIRRNK